MDLSGCGCMGLIKITCAYGLEVDTFHTTASYGGPEGPFKNSFSELCLANLHFCSFVSIVLLQT